MVFTEINSFEYKILLQDEEIKKLKKQNLKLEEKLKELVLEVKNLKKNLNKLQ
tara:strand:+ start:171 stop:329 length:159 start_codon:yes stop_codon:yes gene_type:complete